jgi:2-amino-4-hydroxy-6-hydroxymethyldihydropteridine diphosphokinase
MTVRLGYLGLGSNLGDRRANLQVAVEELWVHGVQAVASSPVYETAPWGVLDQPDFLNACVQVETALEPERLLDACKEIERALGREAGGVRNGPRPIDVDILLLEGVEMDTERLSIPHKGLMERTFVLVPLLALDPPDRERLEAALDALGPVDDVRSAGPPLEVRG